jgi:lincosamide nucleotidyltransferase A/C/D/E
LDIDIQHKDAAQVRALFGSIGFREISRKYSWESNFVLKDDRGRQLDVHSYAIDQNGNHVHGVAYPLDSLSGKGAIEGYTVRCITPEWLVKFHTGYIPDEDDYHDVKLLCSHFGLKLPLEYAPFESSDVATPNRRSDRSDL